MTLNTRAVLRTTNFRAVLRKIPIILIALAAVVGFFYLRPYLTFDALAQNRTSLLAFRDANFALASAAFIATYIAVVGLSLPGGLMATLAGGFLFGMFPGLVYNALGASVGAAVIFLAARAGGGADVAAKLNSGGGIAAKVQRAMAENEISALLMMRLIPGVPFFLANLIPAFMGTSLWRFFWTTVLGILPAGAVFTSVGAGLGAVFAAGTRPDLGIIFTPPILLPLLALALLSALPIVLRAFSKSKG
jgi:uncharacterized membrane protein YdjX (TVP38/TMEM64 family)